MYHIRIPTHIIVSMPSISTHIDVCKTNIVFKKEHVNF